MPDLPLSSDAVTIVVPAYDQAMRLQTAVGGVIAAASTALERYEMIVVNEGSLDDRAAIADGLAASRPHVSIIHQPLNYSVDAAGMQAARITPASPSTGA